MGQLQDVLRNLRQIRVGSEYETLPGNELGPFVVESPAYFNPESPPQIRPTGEEARTMPSWEMVKAQFDRVSAVISNFANLSPPFTLC